MEALGLIDAIIATLLESPRQRFAKDKAVVHLPQILDMLEKLKIVLQRGGEFAKRSVSVEPEGGVPQKKLPGETNPELFGLEGEALLRQAKDQAERIKLNADKYAENVLTNLQLIITKMMRNIDNGKERLKKYKEVS